MRTTKVKHVNVSLADGPGYQVPYWEIDSGREGPCVLVTAAQHGNEIQGTEILRRTAPALGSTLTRGRCILVPVANPLAVRQHQPHLDFELTRIPVKNWGDNLNCTWPGDAAGNNAQRLSHALFSAFVEDCTHCLDIHCWNSFWAGTALVREGCEEAMRLARGMALRFVRCSPALVRPTVPCTLSAHFTNTGRIGLCLEFSGQYGLWERELIRGERALRNLFSLLDMIDAPTAGLQEEIVWVNDAEIDEVDAPCDGLFAAAPLHPSDWVEKGALLGHILRADTLESVSLHAPESGYLYQFGACHAKTSEHSMMWTHPSVTEGEMVAKLMRNPTCTGPCRG